MIDVGGRIAENERPAAMVIVHAGVRGLDAYGADGLPERTDQRDHGIVDPKHDLAEPLSRRVAVAVSS